MWWKNKPFGSRKDQEEQQQNDTSPFPGGGSLWQQQNYQDTNYNIATMVPPVDPSSAYSYPAPPRDHNYYNIDLNNNNHHHYDTMDPNDDDVDQIQNSNRSRMNRLTRNFQSYGRKRVDRLTTTFQSYGRTPSLFYPSFYIPPDHTHMKGLNNSLYNRYSGSESKQYVDSPITEAPSITAAATATRNCKHEGYLDNCDCFDHEQHNEAAIPPQQNSKRKTIKSFFTNYKKKNNHHDVITTPAVVVVCPHHNCGGKQDPYGMTPAAAGAISEEKNISSHHRNNSDSTIGDKRQHRNDTHNMKKENNNNYPTDRSVITNDDSTVVPMYDTKADAEAERQRQAEMHRGRFYEMLRKQPHDWFPLFSYLSALGMLVVLVVSFIQNRQLTGSIIQVNPFNMMLGPSTQVLVFEGARYSPCMRSIDHLSHFACPDTPANGSPSPPSMILGLDTSKQDCGIQDVCGMTSLGDDPNQGYRVITAIFVHSGIVHYFCNMLVHLGLGRRVERRLNPLRYGSVWVISGVFGFIVSTTFSPTSSATMGCSGSLYGIAALLMIDLFRSWRLIADPGWQLTKLITLIVLGLAYGYLPGPDNFAHIAGFVAGLLVGLVVMPSTKPNYYVSKARTIFKWIMRAVMLALLGVASFLLLNTFYKGEKPEELFSWCKYLACLPIGDMCNVYNV
ncbi:rhomboid family-domain-containing protein [Phascolomyces articulosus]|uniref:Rhomboid-type serine protease n=1 Tax=Phascolomyces articulosus TaxID=60185 RepID=A0AAD5JN37_9FUNG|nr:rhomboid family-domain-containing protein [Phascolomyces articulosus]